MLFLTQKTMGSSQILGNKEWQMCSVWQELHLRCLLNKPGNIKRQVLPGNLNLGMFRVQRH